MILAIILVAIGLALFGLHESGITFPGITFSGNLTATQIAQYAANAGFFGNDLTDAVAIAEAESGGNPNAQGDFGNPNPNVYNSFGLWQINVGENPQFAGSNLADPQTNANAAYAIYEQSGFSGWTTYRTGAYLAFITEAQVGVQNA